MPNQVQSRQLPQDVESARYKYKNATNTAVGWCAAQRHDATSKSEKDIGCARLLSLAIKIKQNGTDVPELVCWAFIDAIENRKRVMRHYQKIPSPTDEDLDATETHEYFIFVLDTVYQHICKKFIAGLAVLKSASQQAASQTSKINEMQNIFESLTMSDCPEESEASANRPLNPPGATSTAEAESPQRHPSRASTQGKDSLTTSAQSQDVPLRDDALDGNAPAKTIHRIESILKPFDQKCAVAMTSWSGVAQQGLPSMVASVITSTAFEEVVAISGTVFKQLLVPDIEELFPLLCFIVAKSSKNSTTTTTSDPNPESTGATLAAAWQCLLKMRKNLNRHDKEGPAYTKPTPSTSQLDWQSKGSPVTLAADAKNDRLAMESLLQDIVQVRRKPKLAFQDVYIDSKMIAYIQSATAKDCTFQNSFIAAFALQLAFASFKSSNWPASERHDSGQWQGTLEAVPLVKLADEDANDDTDCPPNDSHNTQLVFVPGLPPRDLEFANSFLARLRTVRKHWSLQCDCGLGFRPKIDRMAGKVGEYVGNSHKELCTQSPWLASNRVVYMMKDADDLGRGLCGYQSITGTVLHLYNVLRRKGGLEAIPVLDAFCELLMENVFRGQLPGSQFCKCFQDFVGGEQLQETIVDLDNSRNCPSLRSTWNAGKKLGDSAEAARQERAARSTDKPPSFFYTLVGKTFSMDTDLWARVRSVTAKSSQVAQRQVSKHHRQLKKDGKDPLENLQGRLSSDFKDTLPVATVDYFRFYEDLAEVWGGVMKEPIIRDRFNIERSKCRCFDGDILIPWGIGVLLDMADAWEDRGAAQAAMRQPPWGHWIQKFREKFKDTQVSDYTWGNI